MDGAIQTRLRLLEEAFHVMIQSFFFSAFGIEFW